MERKNQLHSSIKSLISEIKGDKFSPLINILFKQNEDYQKIIQDKINEINEILANMENNSKSININNIKIIKYILKSCNNTVLKYFIDSKIGLKKISMKLTEISSEYLAFIKSITNNKNLAAEMKNVPKKLEKNTNNLYSEKIIKRSKTINNNLTSCESNLSIKYSKLSKDHYIELLIENLEKKKENKKLKQYINEIESELNNLKSKRKSISIEYQEKRISRNNNELDYLIDSTQEQTITSNNKIDLNAEIENQSLKEKIKTLEDEIKILQNGNNGLYDMGKKQIELLQQLDNYKFKNEQLKNQLKKNQNEYLLNEIKEIEKKYNKEKENKKILEEDIHNKIVQINDLKLEIYDLKNPLTNNVKNDENIIEIQELKNNEKEEILLKSQNQELENINASLLNGQTLKNDNIYEIEYNSAEIVDKK